MTELAFVFAERFDISWTDYIKPKDKKEALKVVNSLDILLTTISPIRIQDYLNLDLKNMTITGEFVLELIKTASYIPERVSARFMDSSFMFDDHFNLAIFLAILYDACQRVVITQK